MHCSGTNNHNVGMDSENYLLLIIMSCYFPFLIYPSLFSVLFSCLLTYLTLQQSIMYTALCTAVMYSKVTAVQCSGMKCGGVEVGT